MAKTKDKLFHKITVMPLNPDEVMSGQNAIIYLDGKELTGVTNFNFSLEVGSLARVQLEMIANFEMDGEVGVAK